MKTLLSLHRTRMTVLIVSTTLALSFLFSCGDDDPELASDKSITSFSFLVLDNPGLSEDIQGTISGQTIFCTVPAGVSITALKPTIVHTGKSLDPASGTTTNFATPVTYTVTAEDGSSLAYSTTVSVSEADPVVYVAGGQFISGTSHATVWKDGIATNLTNGTYNATGTAVFVSDNTIYVAGYQSIGHNWATYWTENETASGSVELNETTNDAYANAIGVSANNDVYVAGQENHGGPTGIIAKVWKNGTATALTTATGAAHSVFVSGNDIYVAGWETTATGWVTKVWKNNVATTLSEENEKNYGHAVFVSGSDVYVAGQYWNGTANVIKVWKNGVPTIIDPDTQGADVWSIFVSDGDVYLAGNEIRNNVYNAKIWKNGVGTFLSSTAGSDAKSIYVHHGDVYVAGWEYINDKQVATLWKNGVASTLAVDGFAYSVMVK